MLGIFLDSEATGLNPHIHRLLEIAYKIIDLKTGVLKESYQALVCQPEQIWKKSDPQSLKINGFTYAMNVSGKKETEVQEEIILSFQRSKIHRTTAVFICQNPSFDRAYFSQLIDPNLQETFMWPYHWLDLASMFWALQMNRAIDKKEKFPWEIGISKDQIATFLHLDKESVPHRAMNGVDHLLACYRGIVGFPKL
jgi:oligoribonuclease